MLDVIRRDAFGYFPYETNRANGLVVDKTCKDWPASIAAVGLGLTASDGPGEITRVINGVERQFFGYRARGVPDGPDDGTIAPWAVVASLPFAPEIVLPTVADFQRRELYVAHPYGFNGGWLEARA